MLYLQFIERTSMRLRMMSAPVRMMGGFFNDIDAPDDRKPKERSLVITKCDIRR